MYKFIASLSCILDMGRLNYVGTICSEHFTRKYSAKRHNITVHHNNGGEIVPLVVAFTKIGNNFVYLHELHLPVSFLHMYQI